jgi:hypothetical protein
MSRKIYLHLIENGIIDIRKQEQQPPNRDILSEYWEKYLKKKFNKK